MSGVLLLRGLIVVAVGVGFLIGAGGVLLYEQFTKKRHPLPQRREVAQPETTVTELPNEQYDVSGGRLRRRVPRRASSNSFSTACSETTVTELPNEQYEVSGGRLRRRVPRRASSNSLSTAETDTDLYSNPDSFSTACTNPAEIDTDVCSNPDNDEFYDCSDEINA
jgi:hypothetical protein